MREKCLALLLLILFIVDAGAQNSKPAPIHKLSFKTQFLQLKDGYNYGLTHSGLNLAGGYSVDIQSDRMVFSYESEIGFGMNYNEGMGLAWSFKPFDFYYGFPVRLNSDLHMMLGPYLSGYYKWQLYPELQSGHMLWLSSYEMGPEIRLTIPFRNRILNASISSSLAGLTSRPQTSPESYFYSLTFKDFASNVHSNMSFASLNLFQHLNLHLILLGKNTRRTIGYEFEYISFTGEVKFQQIIHSLNLSWQIGNAKKKIR